MGDNYLVINNNVCIDWQLMSDDDHMTNKNNYVLWNPRPEFYICPIAAACTVVMILNLKYIWVASLTLRAT